LAFPLALAAVTHLVKLGRSRQKQNPARARKIPVSIDWRG